MKKRIDQMSLLSFSFYGFILEHGLLRDGNVSLSSGTEDIIRSCMIGLGATKRPQPVTDLS